MSEEEKAPAQRLCWRCGGAFGELHDAVCRPVTPEHRAEAKAALAAWRASRPKLAVKAAAPPPRGYDVTAEGVLVPHVEPIAEWRERRGRDPGEEG